MGRATPHLATTDDRTDYPATAYEQAQNREFALGRSAEPASLVQYTIATATGFAPASLGSSESKGRPLQDGLYLYGQRLTDYQWR